MQKQQRHLDAEFIAKLTPRGGLQAAEFEDKQLGYFSVEGSRVLYIDAELGVILLSTELASSREAALQLSFYRSTFQNVEARRAAFNIATT